MHHLYIFFFIHRISFTFFLIKAFIKSENFLALDRQAFISCKNRENEKIRMQIFRQKLVDSNVILVFWDRLKPKILFVAEYAIEHPTLLQTSGSAPVMNNTNVIKLFNSESSEITTITNIILKIKRMTKTAMVANHALFTVITFSRVNSFAYISSTVIKHL